jgi:uncharacterized protein YbaR (Trm112 family)/ubiquinone/menaquinone biosynthesis C-methylase UbiE
MNLSWLLELLACPVCRGPLNADGQRQTKLHCVNCNKDYPIVDNIPVLFSDSYTDRSGNELDHGFDRSHIDHYIAVQRSYYDAKYQSADWWYEIDRPHNSGNAVKFMTYYPMEDLVRNIPASKLFNGTTILNVGCGTGLEAEYFSKFNCNIVGLDFSLAQLRGAIERAKRYNFDMKLIAGEITHIPLRDRSVDFSISYEALHHLFDPYDGLREMCRVARRGVLVIEPRRSLVRTLALHLGLATNVEVVGNIVKDMHEDRLMAVSHEFGFKPFYIRRHFYKEFFQPPEFFRLFDRPIGFWLFRRLFHLMQLFACSATSNKLTFFSTREAK